jgi:hypothetical protein
LLQALGAAGLITLTFIRRYTKYRWMIGFILLVVYQVLLDRYWLDEVISAVHKRIHFIDKTNQKNWAGFIFSS